MSHARADDINVPILDSMCSEPVTCERGRTLFSAYMKGCGPNQLVFSTIGSMNSLGLAAAHARPRRRPDRDVEFRSELRWFAPLGVRHTSGER
jgi:hypothetical protein